MSGVVNQKPTQAIDKMKRRPREWEETFANCTPDKRLISEIHKVLALAAHPLTLDGHREG